MFLRARSGSLCQSKLTLVTNIASFCFDRVRLSVDISKGCRPRGRYCYMVNTAMLRRQSQRGLASPPLYLRDRLLGWQQRHVH